MPQPRFQNIRAVTFDAAHTLFHPTPSVGAIYQEVMRCHGLDYPEDKLEAGFRHAFQNVRKDSAILDGDRREHSYWKAIVRDSISGLSPQPSDFDSLFEDLWNTFAEGRRWKLEPTARETLASLRKRGYQLALLTNWDCRVHSVLADHDLKDAFDAIVVSSKVGHEKPDLPIFRHTESAIGQRPSNILHIGDSLQHDIQGAEAAGWKAIRICDETEAAERTQTSIRRLNELLGLLPSRPDPIAHSPSDTKKL